MLGVVSQTAHVFQQIRFNIDLLLLNRKCMRVKSVPNRKKQLILVFVSLAMLAFASLLIPSILRTLPSRYLLYFPESIQILGKRDNVTVLPTPAQKIDTHLNELLFARQTSTPIPTIPPVVVQFDQTQAIAGVTSLPTQIEEPTQTPIATPTLFTYPTSYLLNDINHQFQGWNNCGPATIAMYLSFYGYVWAQDDAAAWLKPNPEDRNVSPDELVSFVQTETGLNAISIVNGDLERLKVLVSSGVPVMIETGIDPPGDYSWMDWYGHYYLVVGYDDSSETIQVYDSWLGSGTNESGEPVNLAEGKSINYSDFDLHWRQFNRQMILVFETEKQEQLELILGETLLNDSLMWQSALDQALNDLEGEPENAYLWFNVGTIYTNLAEFELATAAYDQSRQYGLPWRMLWYQFGPYEAYLQTGRYQDIIDLADATLYQRPYFEEAYYYRGLAYFELGEKGKAIQDLRRAIDFNPRFDDAQIRLADVQANP
ncbi:MAG: hypothetical protein ACI9EW_001549 [Cellvibrionaceae bacterium]